MNQSKLAITKTATQSLIKLIRSTLRTFSIAYGTKCTISLILTVLLRRNISMHHLKRIFIEYDDCISFAVFLSMFHFSFKTLNYILQPLLAQYLRTSQITFLSGFISGMAIYFDSPSRRLDISTYMFGRSLASFFSMLLYQKNWISKLPSPIQFLCNNGDTLFMCCSSMVAILFYVYRPWCLEKSYYSFVFIISALETISNIL